MSHDKNAPAIKPVLARLVLARQRAGINQATAALAAGLSRASSLSDLERGRSEIKVRQLIALCGFYNVAVSWVLEGDSAATRVCPQCHDDNVWYHDGYWRCGHCGHEWPDQDAIYAGLAPDGDAR